MAATQKGSKRKDLVDGVEILGREYIRLYKRLYTVVENFKQA